MTRPPVPAGRGSKPTATPVAQAARRLDLPLAEVPSVRSGPGFQILRDVLPDFLVVVAYGEILPPEILEIPSDAAVNLHFSLLPELRGAAPVQRALLEGANVTGVTTMLMSEGLDTGDMLMQAEETIADTDDAGSLGARLASVGARLMVETINGSADGSLVPRPQDERLATYAPKLETREIDWTRAAMEVVNLIRALSPKPGAFTHLRGDVFKVLRATVASSVSAGEPGEVLGSDDTGLIVATGRGSVYLLQVAPAGRKHMSGADFARGYRPTGERMGFA